MQARNLLLLATVVAVFLLIVVGAYVTAAGDGAACGTNLGTDWPLCQGNLLPPLQLAAIAEYTHRLLASLSTLLLFLTTFLFWRAKGTEVSTKRLLYMSSVLIVLEIILGGAVVTQGLQDVLVTIHQANALLIFGLTSAAAAVTFIKR